MEDTWPVHTSTRSLLELVTEAKDYLLAHGSLLRTIDNPGSAESVTYAPFTLFPSRVPKACFRQALSVQRDFNLLIHRVSHDYRFLKECLGSVIKVDEFTRRLWQIYETIHVEGNNKPVSLAMNRSDYMFHCDSGSGDCNATKLKQVEFNTMAAGCAHLSQFMTRYHRYILHLCNEEDGISRLPPNPAGDGLADAILMAWTQYNNDKAVVLFLVIPVELNTYDQRWLEYSISEKQPGIQVFRRSIQDFSDRGTLTDDGKLLIDDKEIAVIYQRSCYTPSHFKTDEDWNTRLMLERSRAVICPSVGYQLAGTKKVQQMLSQPEVLERFLSRDAAARVRETFAAQYSLDEGVAGDKNITSAFKSPEKFVLKPQREGGGNNLFGEDLRTRLSTVMNSSERNAYVLMEKLLPAVVENYPVKPNCERVDRQKMVSELGIFGTLVGTKDEILLNDQQGHLLRTKQVGIDEGGIATGYSNLDSPYLV